MIIHINHNIIIIYIAVAEGEPVVENNYLLLNRVKSTVIILFDLQYSVKYYLFFFIL